MHTPFMNIQQHEDDKPKFLISHNSNGELGFTTTYHVDPETARLIELAIEEGKRRKAAEIRQALGLGYAL